MRPWWERWGDQLDFELAEVQRYALDLVLDESEKGRGRIVLRGSMVHRGKAIQVVAVYPDTFPRTPPQIYAPNLALDRHQNPFGKNLCVLPIGSQYWRARPSVAELVACHVPSLLDAVAAGGAELAQVEVPQGEPVSEFYERFGIGGILLPAMPDAPGPTGTCRIRWRDGPHWLFEFAQRKRDRIGHGLLSHVLDASGNATWSARDDVAAAFHGPVAEIPWVRMDQPPQVGTAKEIADYLVRVHGAVVARAAPIESADVRLRVVALVFPEEVQHRRYEDSWLFLCHAELLQAGSSGGRRRVKESGSFLLRGLRAGRSDLATRTPELRPLRSRCVAIAGVGAIGSVIAIELARAMIGELHLLDHDIVEPGNAVRWAQGFGYAGVEKVVALAHHLEVHYPHTRVVRFTKPIGNAPLEAPADTELKALHSWCRDADLLIDASAEDNVSYIVSDLAAEMGLPHIYAYSVEGYGGVVARLRPGTSGCFHCLLLREADNSAPRPLAPPSVRSIQPFGCSTPTFMAPNIDLLPIAIEATRLAVSTLCEQASGYPKIDGDVFTLQLRSPDDSGLVYPLAWRANSLPAHPDCPVCHALATR